MIKKLHDVMNIAVRPITWFVLGLGVLTDNWPLAQTFALISIALEVERIADSKENNV